MIFLPILFSQTPLLILSTRSEGETIRIENVITGENPIF